MIIDLILDRKDGLKYTPKQFYCDLIWYQDTDIEILKAMDMGDELNVKIALCDYIIKNNYNANIIDYILKNKWL